MVEISQSAVSSGSIDNCCTRVDYCFLLGSRDKSGEATILGKPWMELGGAFGLVLASVFSGNNCCFGYGYAAFIAVLTSVRGEFLYRTPKVINASASCDSSAGDVHRPPG